MARNSPNVPSNSIYLATGIVALGVIVVAWLGRDWVAARFVQVGTEAPAFEATTLAGAPASLADFSDKVVLLNIWATWCPPCRVEMPSMERLYRTLDGEPFEIVAVSVDARIGEVGPEGNPGGDIGAFADSLGLTFPILHDPEGRIMRLYQASMVPESFLIGRDGIVHHRKVGEAEWDDPAYVEMIRRMLARDQESHE